MEVGVHTRVWDVKLGWLATGGVSSGSESSFLGLALHKATHDLVHHGGLAHSFVRLECL